MRTEDIPARKCCELCGATLIDGETDPRQTRSGLEVMRQLSFIAAESPSVALIMIHSIAGKTEAEIARMLHIHQSTVSRRIKRAHKDIARLTQ